MNRAGEKDTLITYERALEAQADLRKFRGSTIERKQMSTKTTFKRVALVAVAALGLGLLSVAPSSATPIAISVVPSATTSAIKTGETATINLTVSGVIGAANDSITVNGAITQGASGSIAFLGTTDSTTANIREGVSTYASSVTIDRQATGGTRAVVQANFVNPTAAGTYVVLIYTTANNSAVQITPFAWTITVTADSKLADTSSTSIIKAGRWSGVAPTADAAVSASKIVSTTPVATIAVTQKNATSSASEAYTAVVTGPGFILDATADTATTAGSTSRVLSIAAPTVASTRYFTVYGDGSAGVGTITFATASGVKIGEETVTFSDTKPASVTAVVKKAYIAAGQPTAKVFAVTIKDAAGNAITDSSATVTGTRSDTTTAGKAIATADLSFTWDPTDKVYYGTATGASTSGFGSATYTITATGTDATPGTKVTTTATTIYSDVVATKVTISAPASAAVGDKITYTLTATEKNGYPVADGGYEGGTANGSIGGIFWNTTTVPDYTSSSVKPFNAGETITTVSGVATKDIYMPVAAGTVEATWTLAGSATAAVGAIDKSIAGTKIVVTTAVTNPGVDAAADAANEATDAANAATDAALAAADAADAATAAAEDAAAAVATLAKSVDTALGNLKKQIAALTALVNKLLKKK